MSDYRRFNGRGNRMPEAERFWLKVARGGVFDCWPWLGATNKRRGGYGQVNFRGHPRRAHRAAWILTFGPIPDDLFVLHRCDNPPCVNPSHLFLGTNLDNSLDAAAKGRTVRGERQRAAKLSVDSVLEIRALTTAGWSQRKLASRFGVSAGAIQSVVERETWAWI